MTTPLLESPAWVALGRHHEKVQHLHLRTLFAHDPDRVGRMTHDAAGVHADLSKHRVTEETMHLLLALARERGLEERRDAMFRGEHVNTTEDRAALHIALRLPRGSSLVVDGRDVVADVHAMLDRMASFARAVRSGECLGASGRPLKNVVNVGIGGSDLGPAMAARALRPHAEAGLELRFVANVDGTDVIEATRGLDPAETLVIVCSKTFTTLETMTNARTLRAWVADALGEDAVARHFVAVSTNLEEVGAFGVGPERTFGFWDWVGGRYSLDSAIGLSTMIAIGPEAFGELLAGFHAMDEHFRETPLELSLPAQMGLLAVWYRGLFGAQAHAVLPYDDSLARFPAYLQQLCMESLGKSVILTGEPVGADTGAVVFGEPGTNGQHSFFQLLHQGTTLVPADVIVVARPAHALRHHHDLLVANAIAQAEALAFGQTADEVRAAGVPEALVPHKVMPGNRPTTTLVVEALTPRALGALVALYEHSVFTQGVVLGINPFDQWGVELGKQLAGTIAAGFASGSGPARDASTNALVRHYLALRNAT